MSNDIVPIFDPITNKFLTFKSRNQVHKDGDWHKGIQANIITKNNTGSFDFLIQERSSIVDIAGGCLDQSLATQMIKQDMLFEDQSLKRGLFEELFITDYSSFKVDLDIKIIKAYSYDRSLFNRELISLYGVYISDKKVIKINSSKINKLQWMEWNKFRSFFKENKSLFTKTAQLYFSNRSLLERFERQAIGMIYNQSVNTSHKVELLHIDYYDQIYTFDKYKGKFDSLLFANKENFLNLLGLSLSKLNDTLE